MTIHTEEQLDGLKSAAHVVSEVLRRMCHAAEPGMTTATLAALGAAVQEVRPGARLNRIGHAIERVARRSSLRVVRNLCSHGVGSALHEEPTDITGYFEPHDPRVMHEGMVFTIEPFLSTKARRAVDAGDGWTLVGPKGSVTAQYEHTIVVGRQGPIVLTDLHGLP
jgi:methionyl aminopeptidase